MAEYTTNYNLKKQQGNEYINIEGINNNFDVIDSGIKRIDDRVGGVSSQLGEIETDKAEATDLVEHTENGTIHVTQIDKDTWNAKLDGFSASAIASKIYAYKNIGGSL